MSSIDERIVDMKFNNAQFEKGVSETSKSLDKLKSGLNFDGATKSLSGLNAAGSKFSLASMAAGIDNISSKFSALSIAGITALTNIANRAVDTGIQFARSFTIAPINAGFAEYELKMGSIQTILANTARYGTSLEQVTASLDQLNEYADMTIYNFGDMTKNIGLFTNAGLRVEDATAMIKGFSNEAAASGTTAQGAAGAAYQLSQALSAGTIRLMDWRSLTNVGMGNKNMQNGLIEIADAMGMLEKNSTSATEVQADFNGSLEKNWLSADVMSNYLRIMAGDMDAASMAALGLSDAQIAAFQQQQQTAQDAATKVRTWTQLIGTLQEGVGSSWAQTFDMLLGDFNKATDFFTDVSNRLGGMIGASGDARNALIKEFTDLGGRDAAIQALWNAFDALMGIIGPFKNAMRQIFPPMTAEQLLKITEGVRDFFENLKPGMEMTGRLTTIFKAFFAILDIGWAVIQEVGKLFVRLLGPIGDSTGGILKFATQLSFWIISVRDAVREGDGLAKVFDWIYNAIKAPFKAIRDFGEYISSKIDFGSFGDAWRSIGDALQDMYEKTEPVRRWFVEAFENIKQVVKDTFQSFTFEGVLGTVAVGGGLAAGGGIILMIKKLVDTIKGLLGNVGGGIFDTIKGSFSALTDTMGAMQEKLKAETLGKIAIAIGILTAAVVALSFIETERLYNSLAAIGVMMVLLTGTMTALDKLVTGAGFGKMTALAIGLTAIATAMVIMAAAVAIMSTLDWNELARGLTGLGVSLGLLVGAVSLMSKYSKTMMTTGASLIVLSTAMVILASALKIMSTLGWDEILKGLSAMAAALTALTIASRFAQKAVLGAPAMIALASATMIMGLAMKVFATMGWDEILRGSVAMAAAVGIMVGAVSILSALKMAPVGAATMIAMAGALLLVVPSFKAFAEMSWDEILRASVAMAGALLILSGAMALMGLPPVLLGSVGILAAAAALAMLAPALKLLGGMSWDQIGAGLGALAAALGILAAGGLVMLVALPGLLGLGAAILMIGTGALLASVGLTGISIAITALAVAGAAGAEVFKMAVLSMIDVIPAFMTKFAEGLIEFALVIAGGATEFTMAMSTLLQAMLTAINENAPMILDTIWNLIVLLTEKVVQGVPYLVDAGMRLMTGLLNGIANNIHKLITAATNVITEFLRGLQDNVYKITDQAAKTIVAFVDGLAQAVRNNAAAFSRAGSSLFRAIVDGVAGAIERGGRDLRYAGERIGNALLNGAKNALGINSPSKEFRDDVMPSVFEGIDDGTGKGLKKANASGVSIGQSVINGTKSILSRMSDMVTADIPDQPTITPVLDLTGVRRTASQIPGLMGIPHMVLDRNIQTANDIQATRYEQENPSTGDDDPTTPESGGGDTYEFKQYNYSPKALSQAEIYRNSKSLLAMQKGLNK